MIYLDSAATSLIKPPSVERAVLKAMRSMASPGRGGHRPAAYAAETVYKCREAAAALFNVDDPAAVVFTMNATHALNIALSSLVRPGMRVLISGYEHNSVTRPLKALGAEIIPFGRRLFDRQNAVKDLEKQIENAELVVCTHVSNVFGYILPIYEIADVCRRESIPLVVDASQSAGMLELDMVKLNAAFTAMPGHKGLFGPQGTGILLCGNTGIPLMHGGSGSDSRLQEMPSYLPDRLEAGTHNVCGIAGLLAGMEYVMEKGPETILWHEKTLMEIMKAELKDREDIRLFCGDDQSGVLSLLCYGVNCEELAEKLAEKGICVRAGLHCAPLAHESAGTEQCGTIRFSFSPFNTEEQVYAATQALKDILTELK